MTLTLRFLLLLFFFLFTSGKQQLRGKANESGGSNCKQAVVKVVAKAALFFVMTREDGPEITGWLSQNPSPVLEAVMDGKKGVAEDSTDNMQHG